MSKQEPFKLTPPPASKPKATATPKPKATPKSRPPVDTRSAEDRHRAHLARFDSDLDESATLKEQSPTISPNAQAALELINDLSQKEKSEVISQIRGMNSSGQTPAELKAYQDYRQQEIKAGRPDPEVVRLNKGKTAATPPPPPARPTTPPPAAPDKTKEDPNKPKFTGDTVAYSAALKAYYIANPDKDPASSSYAGRPKSASMPPPPPPPKPAAAPAAPPAAAQPAAAPAPAQPSGGRVADMLRRAKGALTRNKTQRELEEEIMQEFLNKVRGK